MSPWLYLPFVCWVYSSPSLDLPPPSPSQPHPTTPAMATAQQIAFYKLIYDLSHFLNVKNLLLVDGFGTNTGLQNSPTIIKSFVKRLSHLGTRVRFWSPVKPPLTIDGPEEDAPTDLCLVVVIGKDFESATMSSLISKIAHGGAEANFSEYWQWVFVVDTEVEQNFWTILRNLPLRLDSQVMVALRNISALDLPTFGNTFKRVGLEKLFVGLDASATIIEKFYGPGPALCSERKLSHAETGARHSVFVLIQIYKLHAADASSCVCLTLGSHQITSGSVRRPLAVEQRNFFFNRLQITLGVLIASEDGPVDHAVASGQVRALTRVLPVFRDARIRIKEIPLTSDSDNRDMIRAITRGEVDFVYNLNDINIALQDQITYSMALYYEYRNIYLRHPELSELRDIFLAPITTALAVAFILIGITLTLLLRCINNLRLKRRWKRSPAANDPEEHVTYSDAFLWFVGVFCLQGSTINPNSTSSAAIVITALLYALIVYNAYSATITSKLSIYIDEINDLQALLHATDFGVGFVANGADEVYLRMNPERDTQEILTRAAKKPHLKVDSYLQGLEKVLREKFAIFGRHSVIRHQISHFDAADLCAISEVRVSSSYQKTALAMRKDSPFKKLINYEILRFRQCGVTERERITMIPNMPSCNQLKMFNKAKLSDVFSCFALLIMGVCNAVLVLMGEKLHQVYTRTNLPIRS